MITAVLYDTVKNRLIPLWYLHLFSLPDNCHPAAYVDYFPWFGCWHKDHLAQAQNTVCLFEGIRTCEKSCNCASIEIIYLFCLGGGGSHLQIAILTIMLIDAIVTAIMLQPHPMLLWGFQCLLVVDTVLMNDAQR